MRYKGIDFRINRFLGDRLALPGDVYTKDPVGMDLGEQIAPNYLVWVRLKNCPEVSRASWLNTMQEYRIVSTEQCQKIIPITGHSLTNMAYGVPKVDHDNKLIIRPMYLTYDGKCYQGVIKSSRLYLKAFDRKLFDKIEEEERKNRYEKEKY